ncbi:MAG: hypothetical protein LUQ37_03640 [Methanoregulaceae archaeon]|jgi:hypothetical protein|nr:hypothetical protein [Methanoregulaceae archaeon]
MVGTGGHRFKAIFTCSACKKKAELIYEDMNREGVEMHCKLMVGSPDVYMNPPGPESRLGKSECCNAQLSYELEEMSDAVQE